MASPTTLNITRIPRMFHQEQMQQLQQELRTHSQTPIPVRLKAVTPKNPSNQPDKQANASNQA